MIVTPAASPAASAIEHVAHGENGLEGVALRAARRRDIGLAARHPDCVVENRLDGVGVDPARVVLNDDRVLFDDHRDLGRDLGFLAGVERVVDELLGHHQRPVVDRVPCLVLSSRSLQNSISRETLKATRVSFGSLGGRPAWALPQFVKTEALGQGF